MKKIINGKMYNTDTAELVAQDYSEESRSDVHYWWEGLYKKKTGEFFIFYEGAALSKYGSGCCQSGSGWNENIEPLTIEEAKVFLERTNNIEAFEKTFGKCEE